jgi:hypothetical protein
MLAREWSVVVGLLVVLLALTPLLATPLPANDDFLKHLARCYLIFLNGNDSLLDRFYTIDWKPLPNLAIDLIMPTLTGLVGIFMAGKLFWLTTIVLLLCCFQGPMQYSMPVPAPINRAANGCAVHLQSGRPPGYWHKKECSWNFETRGRWGKR